MIAVEQIQEMDLYETLEHVPAVFGVRKRHTPNTGKRMI